MIYFTQDVFDKVSASKDPTLYLETGELRVKVRRLASACVLAGPAEGVATRLSSTSVPETLPAKVNNFKLIKAFNLMKI
jgi:hypothetical protein